MKDPDRPTIQWRFVEVVDAKREQWCWRRLLIDGTTVTSEGFGGLGAAIHDALANGFRPNNDKWATISRAGTAYFDPVKGPKEMTPGSAEISLAGLAGPRRKTKRKSESRRSNAAK